jgi:hypothetical protein
MRHAVVLVGNIIELAAIQPTILGISTVSDILGLAVPESIPSKLQRRLELEKKRGDCVVLLLQCWLAENLLGLDWIQQDNLYVPTRGELRSACPSNNHFW